MKNTSLRSILFAVAMLLAGSASAVAGEVPEADQALAAKLITALVNADYDSFLADGEATFKAMKPDQFAAVAAKLSPVLKTGYAVTYLGSLNQRGYQVSLWKISLKAGGDDLMASLSLRNGKVGGFFIR
jgi:hypothetical protein